MKSIRISASLRVVGVVSTILLVTGCGGDQSTGVGGGSAPPSPPPQITITSAGPVNAAHEEANWVVAGDPSFVLDVEGSGFTPNSVIEWNGAALPTTYGSSSDLNANIGSTTFAKPGTAKITVHDTAPGATSNALPLGIASEAAATAGVVQMITVAPDGSPADDDSLVAASISATGRYVAFQSAATNLVPGHTASGFQEIYERDTCIGAPDGCTPSTVPISVTYNGAPVSGHSRTSSVSADGRYVAFDSSADNMLPSSGTCYALYSCAYVRDTCLGAQQPCTPTTTLLTVSVDGTTEEGGQMSITKDGRYVGFSSPGPNIAQNNPGGHSNVFVYDSCAGAPSGCTPRTTLVSQSTAGMPGSTDSNNGVIGAVGRFVAFQSWSTNLVPGDTNVSSDIFERDTCLGAAAGCSPMTIRVSVSASGAQGNWTLDPNEIPSISSDGRYVAWGSEATNMVPQNVNGFGNIYLRDTCIGAPAGCAPATTLASLANDGSIPNQGQNNQSMDSTGRYVAFASLASNLVPGQGISAGDWKDIFVHDNCLGAPAGCVPSTVRVSVANYGKVFAAQSNAICDYPQISADGHWLVFLSTATNFLPSGGNNHQMVYLAKTGF